MVAGRRIGYINHAQDYYWENRLRRQKDAERIHQLIDLWCQVEILDLRDYFGRQEELCNMMDFGWLVGMYLSWDKYLPWAGLILF